MIKMYHRETVDIVLPHQCDSRGSMMAGNILSKVDIIGGITARRHAGTNVVTASLEAVHFLIPVKTGDILYYKARINRSWNTSMEIGVRVETQDQMTGERKFACHGKQL